MNTSAGATPERSHDDRAHRRLAHRAIVVSALGLLLTGAIELALAIYTGR
jgi:hypothetical protein